MPLIKSFLTSVLASSLLVACAKNSVPPKSSTPAITNAFVDSLQPYLTSSDQSKLLMKMHPVAFLKAGTNTEPTIHINAQKTYQPIEGFGFCLTDGSAKLISEMPPALRKELLVELFGKTENAIGISYLRVSIGASDLSDSVYTYDDMPKGETDPELKHFSIAKAKIHLIPLLKEILSINDNIKILGSPWSAPSWMKDNDSSKGGSLLPKYYESYAQFFVRYIQDMQKAGIHIDAITPQNEPLNPKNNPSMYMSAEAQRDFIKNNLGPAFKKAGIKTGIQIYDHNADEPGYPMTILKDPEAAAYVEGSAFHLYAGDISALSKVHDAFPDKKIFFTEQYTPGRGKFSGELKWHVSQLIVGAVRNWSRNVLEWNLAADPSLNPHTPGGCTTCLGAVTIQKKLISRNPSYYIIAHASKFVPAGSVRIESDTTPAIANVAFKTPEGKTVCIAVNTSDKTQAFNIEFEGKRAALSLAAGDVATYVW